MNQVNLTTEDMSQTIDITPDLLRNFKYIIKIVPNSSLKDTEYTKKATELEWYNLTVQNPLVNQKENLKELAEAYGKDVSRIINTQSPEEMAMAGVMAGMGGKPGLPNNPGAQKMINPL